MYLPTRNTHGSKYFFNVNTTLPWIGPHLLMGACVETSDFDALAGGGKE